MHRCPNKKYRKYHILNIIYISYCETTLSDCRFLPFAVVFRYQINARTELAVRYNDISPLENHHCAVAFQIISNPETNIFSNTDINTFKRIRAVSAP